MLRIERARMKASAWQACALCGTRFGRQRIAFQAYRDKDLVGPVCAECAGADASELAGRLRRGAIQFHQRAAEIAQVVGKMQRRATDMLTLAQAIEEQSEFAARLAAA